MQWAIVAVYTLVRLEPRLWVEVFSLCMVSVLFNDVTGA